MNDWITNWAELRPAGLKAQARKGHAWYAIRNAAADEAEIMLYDEIGGWFGSDAESFVQELQAVTASNITVRLNSPGGSVFDGIAIANALRAHPAAVTVRVDGIAASIASVIALAGDRLVMMPHSQLMIHEASGLCMGNPADMRDMADLLDLQSDNIADVYAAKAGGTRADWRTKMQAETWYLAAEAVAAGLADEVAETPRGKAPQPTPEQDPGAPEMGNRWDLTVFRYAGREAAPTPALARAAVVPEVRNEALPVHHTATVDEPWDGPAAVAAMPNDAKVLRYCHAWEDSAADDGTTEDDPDGDPDDEKTNYKFPHHKTLSGPANLPACRDGLARLEDSSIPEGDKAGVRKHLQAHLDDAAKDENEPEEPADTLPSGPVAADEWAALTAQLTALSPSADDEFTRLKEALL
jgi:ATP-dependent protease ClpP protease subunit